MSPDETVLPGRRHFPLFDALRGIAVLSVLAFHVALLSGHLGVGPDGRVLAVLGPEGVIVFFVISGFLLYRPYVSARAAGSGRPSTRIFFRRRVLRLVPAYWVVLTLFAIFPGIVGVFTGDWWRYYFFLQLYDSRTVLSGLPVAWTLCVEVAFFLVLPLWAWAVRRLPGSWVRGELTALGAVAAGGFAVQLLAARQHVSKTVADTLPGQFPWLAIGMALAIASVVAAHRETEPAWERFVARRSGPLWATAALALAGLALLVPPDGLFGLVAAASTVRPFGEAVAHIVLSCVLATAFVLPAVFGGEAGGLPRRILGLGPAAWIGTVSYSLYLWHLPVAELIAVERIPVAFSGRGLALMDHIQTARTGTLFVLTVAASCAAAAVTYYGIERPCIRRSHRQAASGAYPSGNEEGPKNQHSTA